MRNKVFAGLVGLIVLTAWTAQAEVRFTTVNSSGGITSNGGLAVAAGQTIDLNKNALKNIKIELLSSDPSSADADAGRIWVNSGTAQLKMDRGVTAGGIITLWSVADGNGISSSDVAGVRTLAVDADTTNEFTFTSGVLNLVYGSTSGLPAEGSNTVGLTDGSSGALTMGAAVAVGAGGTVSVTPVFAAPGANSVSLASSAAGSAASFARSDHSHNLDVSIVPTWIGAHTFNSDVTIAGILNLTGTADGIGLNKVAGAPATLAEGEFWYDDTANKVKYRDNDSTETIATLSDTGEMRDGTVACTSGALTATVSFDTAFSDASYSIALGNSGSNYVMARVANKTASSFELQLEANPDTSTFDYVAMR